MNRLVIIGNGFDLAHGLPTKYSDFINDYWSNINNTLYEDEFIKLNIDEIGNYDGISSYTILVDKLNTYFNKYGHEWKVKIEENEFFLYKPLRNNFSKTSLLKFKNDFFRIISNKSIENWVDIENLYYEVLKSESKERKNEYFYFGDVYKLNEEFEQVKNLLEKYLIEKVVNKFDFINGKKADRIKIWDVLKPISLLSNENNIFMEFINAEDVKEIKEHFDKERKDELVNNLYFLNFNYTPLASIYCEALDKDDRIESRMNFIHGNLGNILENKINFGFGDEMDDDYKAIENLNENEYLRNFKSFQYLQNSNYKDLLDYVDSDKFQVLIIGHSCGLSDRTLLNTIFEHNNCRSIKVFYYEEKDKDGKIIKDNYTEIIQNISRHFNKKKLMREKIVNKTLCQPLPQIQLPLK